MSEQKTSYTISCSSVFRQAVLDLAAERRVNAADIARSVMLVVPASVIEASDDPGEPAAEDREIVILKSGPSAQKPWKRKPRLQVRLPSGLCPIFIRKSLGLALCIARETIPLHLGALPEVAVAPPPPPSPPPPPPPSQAAPSEPMVPERLLQQAQDDLERMRTTLSVLLFEPLVGGVQTYEQALHVFGFPPEYEPDSRELRGRFRVLATIHHPDSPSGDHLRMSQLNDAMGLLRQAR